MKQRHSLDQATATASGSSGKDTDGVGRVIDYFSGKMPPPLPRVHAFEFRSLLHAKRRRLLEEMHEIMTPPGDGAPPPVAGDNPHSTCVLDPAMMTIIRNNQQLLEIEVALARLNDGSYGICICCGAGIDRARLKFQPTARYCMPCQLQLIPHGEQDVN